MVDGFYKEVCKHLRAAGFAFKENAKGSHEKWEEKDTGLILLVPRNLASRHTANAILKDAGVGKKF